MAIDVIESVPDDPVGGNPPPGTVTTLVAVGPETKIATDATKPRLPVAKTV